MLPLSGYRFQVLSFCSVLVLVFLSFHSCHCSSQSDANEEIGNPFDAFLGFRGADVRYGFVDHLYTAQVQAGIRVFKDDKGISLGENIDSRIEHVIRNAKISVVVFSKAFATSPWCLKELVLMMQQLEAVGQVVIPVFYHVDPSDVVAQSSPFREAFAGYEKHLKDMKEKREELGRNAAHLALMSLSDGSLELATLILDYCLEHIATLEKEAEDFSKKLEGWKAALKGVEPLSGEVIKEGRSGMMRHKLWKTLLSTSRKFCWTKLELICIPRPEGSVPNFWHARFLPIFCSLDHRSKKVNG